MTSHDVVSTPLAVISLVSPFWIDELRDVWAILLPAGGATLLCLQIVYYWRQLRK